MSDIYSRVKAQFGKTADAYVSSAIHAKGEDLKMLLDLAGDVHQKRVLDVATGGGHTALAFAKAGADVVATDLTPTMLDTARAHLKAEGLEHVQVELAAAEDLPFEAESFDIVTCRIAPHHFADPLAFVKEAARVLRVAGMFLLIDNISPEAAELAEAVNYIEKTRDGSHVEAYRLSTWISWLAEAKLELYYLTRFRRHKPYEKWMKIAQAENVMNSVAAEILDMPEKLKTYLEVQEKDGRLVSLSHEVMLLKAIKLH